MVESLVRKIDGYTIKKQLGRSGAQGLVHLVQDNNGKYFAIKEFLDKSSFITESVNQS
jgi:hypothetical protein